MNFGFNPSMAVISGLGILGLLINLAFLVISIYMIILFIKLAHRGITALDIYINKNRPF